MNPMLSTAEQMTFLRNVSLFAESPDDVVVELAGLLTEVAFKPGDTVFEKGDSGDAMYIIVEGRVRVHWGGRTLNELEKYSVFGEMAVLDPEPRSATVTAIDYVRCLRLERGHLFRLITGRPEVATGIIRILCQRLRARATNVVEDYHSFQRERLATLGRLSAGLAHELNNPASAIHRSSTQLKDAITQLQRVQFQLASFNLGSGQLQTLSTLDQQVLSSVSQPATLDALVRMDREQELETWLDNQGIADSWELAPNLVSLGYEPDALSTLRDTFPSKQAPTLFNWLSTTYTIYNLLMEIGRGAEQMSEIVKAFKAYTYMDQDMIQWVDIHAGLDNTLVILRNKLKDGITVHRQYAADLPTVPARGGELNQVWTNIIDNAVSAMGGKGDIILRTSHDGQWVVVEIEDNGPGIPEDIQGSIFDPFFTTKPQGEGTGLGLHISHTIIVQNHRGTINVTSQPGNTCFTIKLPLHNQLTE